MDLIPENAAERKPLIHFKKHFFLLTEYLSFLDCPGTQSQSAGKAVAW